MDPEQVRCTAELATRQRQRPADVVALERLEWWQREATGTPIGALSTVASGAPLGPP